MLHLVDNDVVLKLARYELLAYGVDHWGGASNVRRLATCRYALCFPTNPAKGLKRCGSQGALDRVHEFCDQTVELPPAQDHATLATLNDVAGIDSSEALLFATCAEISESLSYTGDKRSIVALSQEHRLAALREALKGRVHCLEQLVAALIAVKGLALVVAAIRSDPDADTALRAIVGSENPPKLQSIWEGLKSYYMDLNKRAIGLLAPFPAEPKQ